MNKEFGWHYPPGTEFHPDAPWNQEEPEMEVYEATCRIWIAEKSEEDATAELELTAKKMGWDIEVMKIEKE